MFSSDTSPAHNVTPLLFVTPFAQARLAFVFINLTKARFTKASVSVALLAMLFGTFGANTTLAQSFASPVNYTVGTFPSAAAFGDFNGDAKPDLAVANSNAANISVLFGNGDGTFGAKTDYEVGQSAIGVVVTDLNGDGKLDIVAHTFSGSTLSVSVLRGNGDGTFQARVDYTFSGSSVPRSIAVADFNNDSKPDVIVASGSSATVLLGNGDGTLSPPVSLGSFVDAVSLTVGDFNTDNKIDLAFSSFGFGDAGIVRVMLGNGDGTFAPPVNYTTGVSPQSIVKGDFNGDGKIDLATANVRSPPSVSVLLGNGDGTFQTLVNYAADSPFHLSVADVNNDGKLDLVGASNGFGLSVLKGDGNGAFQKSVIMLAGGRFSAVLDLNGDSKPDIVSAGAQANSVGVFLNQTGPHSISGFTRDNNGTAMSGVTVSLSGGAPSVVTSDALGAYAFNDLAAGQTFTVTPLRTNYTFAPANQVFTNLSSNVTADFVGTLNNYSISGRVRDVFGNGISGVTVTLAGASSGTVVTTSDGNYAFTNLTAELDYTVTPSRAKFMFTPPAAAFTNLSSNRIVNFTGRVATYSISGGVTNVDNGSNISNLAVVLTGSISGNAITTSSGYNFTNLPVDGDYQVTAYAAPPTALFTNYLLLAPSSRSFEDLSSNMTGNFSAKRLGFNTGNLDPVGIARADLNGDGKPDLAVATSNGSNIHVLLGNGDGTFQPQVAYFSGNNPYDVVIADFNADGKMDVASANSHEPNVSVFIGNGDGTLNARVTYPVSSNPNTLETADFNLDGKVDLVSLGSPNKIAVLLGTGNGTFQAAQFPTAPTAIFSILPGELNGDGKPDLVTLDFSGVILVLLGRGDGTFENPVSFSAGTEVVKAALGDFNADGKLDAAVATRLPNTVKVLLGRGDGTFQSPLNHTIPAEPSDLTIQDFDGDGKSDLAIVGFNGGLFFLAGNGDGTLVPPVVYQVPTFAGSLVGGDFNNDGKRDLALSSGSEVNVLLNSGSTRAPAIQLSSTSASASEGAGNVTVTVTRSGNTSLPASVSYKTSDSAGLADCAVLEGKASERCDFVTTLGLVTFAAGESLKSFVIPIIDDALVEGTENFVVTLSGVSGAMAGSGSTATITIVDNDSTPVASNPIDGVEFFIRQQYLDILGRQPDQTGFQNWVNTLANCPNGGFGEPPTSNCDRLHVAAGFFQSDEFLNRGYWAFRFYMVAFSQRPTYAQFIPDMSQVGGPKSPAEEEASKVVFADAFVQRTEFLSRYGFLNGQPLADALLQTAGLPAGSYNAGGQTNGQILRGIAQSQAALNRFLTEGTVSILYFGFQRRDPDTVGYQNNVATLNANPNNLRHMIFIFIYSNEYRGRFGPAN